MNQNATETQILMLGQVFTPSSPIIVKDFFAGRTSQINKAIDTILEKGRHAILYGVRGVGKTSLANIISGLLDIPSLWGTKVICSDSDTFGSLWIKTLKQIPISSEEHINEIGFPGAVKTKNQTYTLADCLTAKPEDLQPSDVIELLEKVSNTFFFVFDEFDTIENSRTKKKFAEMIKALSDKMPNVTLLIVGVGETITDLIGEHQSIERCLNQILLEKMKENELEEILNKGLAKLEMSIDDTVKNKIISFSKGFAHYTHLLGKYSAQSALSKGRTNITELDFNLAIDEAIQNAQESLRECYQRAVSSNKKNMFKDIVKACTLVKEDEHGTFRIKDLQEPLLKIIGEKTPPKSYQYHVGRLCTPEKGNILQKIGTKNNFRYKFKNPLFKAYMTLKIYQEEHQNF